MRKSRPLADRMWAFISPEPNSGCWLWDGYCMPNGYGRVGLNGKTELAHRAVYETAKGPIPAGLTLDHKCRVRCCVNPDHLEPVTNAVNLSRGIGPELTRARWKLMRRDHCPQGHVFDEHNTHLRPDGRRTCKTCARAATARSRSKQMEV